MVLAGVARAAAGQWDNLRTRETIEEAEARFALLVERRSRFVFRIAYAVLRNVEDADDVVQETFFKLFRTGAWKDMENEQAFLARMAWRLSISKKPTRHSSSSDDLHELWSDKGSPERLALGRNQIESFKSLIDALPERLRRPLALSSIEEFTAGQIAAVMGLPEGTVRRLLTEARRLLKEKLVRMQEMKRG